MEEQQIIGLIKLLDDCHTELSKAEIESQKYNNISSRLIGAKMTLNHQLSQFKD